VIRLGAYDADDKWEMLCRYWENPASVTESVVDKWNRPVLPHWAALGRWGGRDACVEYIRVGLLSTPPSAGAEPVIGYLDSTVSGEMAQLAARVGDSGLRDLVHKLIDTITTSGFLAAFEGEMSARLTDRLREVFKAGAVAYLKWADERGEIPSLEVLRMRKGTFPENAIKYKRKVLSLFPALYYGRNDVIHIYDICPDHVTLVDLNAEALTDIQLIYPNEWTYVCSEFKEFLGQAAQRQDRYDLVVADPPKDLGVPAAWDMLPTIMALGTDTFITNYFAEMFEELGVGGDDLDGLSRAVRARTGVDVVFAEILERNSAVSWAVMRRR
jgi:hypothetical protein